jgi:hypothetical protein
MMDKTRKAFVVLAAAVTAGNAGGCGSNSTSSEDAKTVDALATVDSKVAEEVASTPDTQREEVAADSSQRDAGGADATLADAAVDLTTGEVMAVDGGATDTSKLDGMADTLGADVLLRLDASVSADAPGPLVMPAGTLYDVLTREHLA